MSNLIEVKVPDIGDFSDVPVIDLFVKLGDSIKVDDAICTLESDKATMDVPSTVAGVVQELLVNIGDKVSEGSLLIKVASGAAAARYASHSRESPPRAATGGIPMVLLEFSMTPLTKGESVSTYVARSLDIVDRSGLPYQLTPMGTIVEGDWADVMTVVTQCFETMRADCDRISTQIRIDYRAGPGGRLQAKVEAVERKLGRKLST